MKKQELNQWFCSLSIQQKEHIACRVLKNEGKNPQQGRYPNCIDVWEGLSEERQNAIHDHCTDKHGMWIQEPGDGPIYSY